MIKIVVIALSVSLLSGCATKGGSYCDLSQIITVSHSDKLTTETKRLIVQNNEKYEEFCQ